METHCVWKRYPLVVCLVLTLFLVTGLFSPYVFAATQDSLLNQLTTTIAAPPVLLQVGTSGISTIYANSTSAKVHVDTLQYNYSFKASNIRVTNTSGTPVDDPQAVLNIVLSQNSTLFAIYNAGNLYGSTEWPIGKGCAINVDGTDVAFSWQSPYFTNEPDSVTVIYAANLTSGPHVIKGRFFANSAGNTVGIDYRQIVAFWFPSVVASFVRSNVSSTTTSSTPVDDPQATLTFSLSSSSIALIVYNVGNKYGSTEPEAGKGITIKVDGSDIGTSDSQSEGSGSNMPNSVTIAYAGALGVGSHTVTGRFFSNAAGSTTTIDERQLMIFCFPTSAINYGFIQNNTSVSTSSGTPVNDTQAVLKSNLTAVSDSLIMYVASNLNSPEGCDGKGVNIQIDGTDLTNSTSCSSPWTTDMNDSSCSVWVQQLTVGSHVIQGRFDSNNNPNSVTVSTRQLLMIAFPNGPRTYDYVLKVVSQDSVSWNLNLNVLSSTNIGRLSQATISFHDGNLSNQIIVNNGVITQSKGPTYSLAAGATTFIEITSLQTNATGMSTIVSILNVTVPNKTTYILYVVTFELA